MVSPVQPCFRTRFIGSRAILLYFHSQPFISAALRRIEAKGGGKRRELCVSVLEVFSIIYWCDFTDATLFWSVFYRLTCHFTVFSQPAIYICHIEANRGQSRGQAERAPRERTGGVFHYILAWFHQCNLVLGRVLEAHAPFYCVFTANY